MRAFKLALCILSLPFAALSAAANAPLAGTASIVAGSVSAVALDGRARTLQKDDAVYAGDRIVTGFGSYVRIGLLDGGSMVLRPNTEFAIERFSFQPGVVESAVKVVAPAAAPAALPLQVADQAGVGNQAFFRLVRGGFRAVSGLVGKINREEYAVRTPVATIGIRGTAFSSVFCDAVCAADAVVQGSLPAGESALGGIVSAVDQGSIVVVSSSAQTAVLQPSQFLLTTASGMQVSLTALPGFLSTEGWLNAAPAEAPPSSAAPAAGPASSALSTVPTLSSIAAVIFIGATALSTDQQTEETNNGNAPPSGTGTATSTTTSTSR